VVWLFFCVFGFLWVFCFGGGFFCFLHGLNILTASALETCPRLSTRSFSGYLLHAAVSPDNNTFSYFLKFSILHFSFCSWVAVQSCEASAFPSEFFEGISTTFLLVLCPMLPDLIRSHRAILG